MTHVILSNLIASISELKTNPMALFNKANGKPIAILNRNQPVFYCISPELFEIVYEKLQEAELTKKTNDKDIKMDINIL